MTAAIARASVRSVTPEEPNDGTPEADFDQLLEEDPGAALAEALAWIAEEPGSADAHYAAGLSYEALSQEQQQIREFLEVLRLDALDTTQPIANCERIIVEEVEATLAELPAELVSRLGPVAILIEPRPSADLVKDGYDPRLLGLFDGATSEQLSGPDAPAVTTTILLYSHNLVSAFEDEASLREEVTVTVLHEIGHFFGLEEEDLERLGLD